MSPFHYTSLFQNGPDPTEYVFVTNDHVSQFECEGRPCIKVAPAALRLLAQTALTQCNYYLRKSHIDQLIAMLSDQQSSENDRYVATTLMQNLVVASNQQLPMCQDTGTAIIVGYKGEQVWTGTDDKEHLSHGIYDTYTEQNLRYSQMIPLSMFEEVNSQCNLPAQIDIYAVPGDEYHFLFMAKGGGSANKTFLYQETKSLLNEAKLIQFIRDKLSRLGTAACPPYHLAVVIGGTSAEMNLKTVKLASAHQLDELPTSGNSEGCAFRDLVWEEKILDLAQKTGIGAQFGGRHLCHDVRVIRLPRHAASNPVSIAVSCSADRNIKGKITADGLFIEKLQTDLSQFTDLEFHGKSPVSINLDQPMSLICQDLSQYPVGTLLHLTGTLIVARDIAHARIDQLLTEGKPMPEYMLNHPVYYAGPSKTPPGMISGSFGPTTAGRMDVYVDRFQKKKGSLIMIAKGNRSQKVTEACKNNGGFYLGSIGGPAAVIAQECITEVTTIDFEELGMEAVRKIRVNNFPVFILCDNKGNDLFQQFE